MKNSAGVLELLAVACGMRQRFLAIGHATFAGLTWTCYDAKWLTGQHFSLSYSCVCAPAPQTIVKQRLTSVGPLRAHSVCLMSGAWTEKRWDWHIISQSAWPPQLHFHRLHHHQRHHSCICGHDWRCALCDLSAGLFNHQSWTRRRLLEKLCGICFSRLFLWREESSYYPRTMRWVGD